MVAMDSFRTDLRERLRKPEILLRIAPSPASGELVELSGTDLVDSAERLAKAKTAAQMIGVALIIVGERPWPVAGATLVGVALLLGLATLPRYFLTRLT